jgi:hypothetical protein
LLADIVSGIPGKRVDRDLLAPILFFFGIAFNMF